MIDSACAGRRPCILEAGSPPSSLAWTSLRTPNCRLASARARRVDCFTSRCPPAQGKGRSRSWRIFSLAVRVWTFIKNRSKPGAAPRAGGPVARGDAPLGHDDPGPSDDGRLNGRAGRHPRGDGIDRGVLVDRPISPDFTRYRSAPAVKLRQGGACPGVAPCAWLSHRRTAGDTFPGDGASPPAPDGCQGGRRCECLGEASREGRRCDRAAFRRAWWNSRCKLCCCDLYVAHGHVNIFMAEQLASGLEG